MDPNETLKMIRELAEFAANPNRSALASKASLWEAVELFKELDEWLSKGGFLPDAWNRDRTERKPYIPELPHGPYKPLSR